MVLSDEDIVRLYQDPKFFGSFSGRNKWSIVFCLICEVVLKQIPDLGASNLRQFLFTDYGEVRKHWCQKLKQQKIVATVTFIACANVKTLSDSQNNTKLRLQCKTYSELCKKKLWNWRLPSLFRNGSSFHATFWGKKLNFTLLNNWESHC